MMQRQVLVVRKKPGEKINEKLNEIKKDKIKKPERENINKKYNI